MSASWRSLAFLAVVIGMVLIIPSSAAHGGDPGAFSSHGVSGQAGTAAAGWGSGGTSHGIGTGGAAQGYAAQESSETSPAAGEGGQATFLRSGGTSPAAGTANAVQARAGQESRSLSSETGYGSQAGYRGVTVSAATLASQGPGFQGGTNAGTRYGAISSRSGGDETLPRGQHQGPPSHAQPYGPGTQAGRIPCGPAQTAEPLAGASGLADPGTKVLSPPRGRKDSEDESDGSLEPEPSWPWNPSLFLPALGYRRIGGKNVLEHDARNRVYRTIVEHPGIDIVILENMVEMNRNTLRYHLFTLLRTGKITAFSRPGLVRYYQNQGMYPPFVQCLLHYLWTETPREIITLLWHSPGMTRAELAAALSFSGPSITRHMQNLTDDAIVETRILGRNHHYSLTPAALEILGWCEHMAQRSRDFPPEQASALPSAA